MLQVPLVINFDLPTFLIEACLFSATMWLCTSHFAGCDPSASISDVRIASTNGAVWALPVSGVAPSPVVHASPMPAIKYTEPVPLIGRARVCGITRGTSSSCVHHASPGSVVAAISCLV